MNTFKPFRPIILAPLLACLFFGLFMPPARSSDSGRLNPGKPIAPPKFEVQIKDQNSMEFRILDPQGADLKPGTCLIFDIPLEFQGRILGHGMLKFRKRPEFHPEGGWDNDNAWVSFWGREIPGESPWIQWKDQFGPEKRAAVQTPEHPKKNTFLDCPGLLSSKPLGQVAISCRGDGNPEKSVATIHSLTLAFLGLPETGPTGPLNVTGTFQKPVRVNSCSLRYPVEPLKGKSLGPGETLVFMIPPDFQSKRLMHAMLTHRKDPSLAADPENPDAWDPNPSYVLFEGHDRITGLWHSWADRSGSAKFSEVRGPECPEDEILHNCLKALGHISMDQVRLTQVGKGDPLKSRASIHELQLVFRPGLDGPGLEDRKLRVLERLYTPETRFADPGKGRPVPLFGGGPRLDGRFPRALILGAGRHERARKILELPQEYRFEITDDPGPGARVDALGRLHIALEPGTQFLFFELALGDLDITSLTRNKDGYFGRSGSAEINIWLKNFNYPKGERDHLLLKQANVGMACLHAAGPPCDGFITMPGDEIMVEVIRDPAFVMGFRLYWK